MNPIEQPPGLLHNIGWAPHATIVWRGLGRGPLADDTERIEVARQRGTWLRLQLAFGPSDARYHRDWNSAVALLRLLEPEHGLGEAAAARRLTQHIDAHTERLDWPGCLLVGSRHARREQQVKLDHALTTFVALSKSTGSLWRRDRVPHLAPLHAPELLESSSVSMRGVCWSQALWFADGIPPGLLDQARAQLKPRTPT